MKQARDKKWDEENSPAKIHLQPVPCCIYHSHTYTRVYHVHVSGCVQLKLTWFRGQLYLNIWSLSVP